jgi:thioester reductase-like protein
MSATAAAHQTLESAIVSVAARCLRTSVPAVGPDTPFALLGIDSLAAIELAIELEQALGVKVNADLIAECTNARTLAARLSTRREEVPEDDEFDRMLADAVLPDDVRPAGGESKDTRGLESARTVLLTGATGFLGGSLLRALLDRSRADVVCLVRSGNSDARARLQAQLDTHGAGVDTSDQRIRIVEGDLSHPRLGLTASAFAQLAGSIDAICHAGAAVNWVSSYSALRASNVGGTLELIRLACLGGSIPVHFVSSLSVCYSTSAPPEVDESFDPLPHIRGVHLGYAQTKIVAEALVRQAGARGLPVTISRPAIISGHSRTGAFNRDDVLASLIRGCIRMGTAPDLDWQLDSQPVDVVASGIVALSDACGRTFHFRHAGPRHWRECVLWMRLYGYPLRLVPYHAWLRQLDQDTGPRGDRDHPLRPLRSFFLDRPDGAGGMTRPELYEDARRTDARADSTGREMDTAAIACPALDASLLETYFAAYIRSGYLAAPQGSFRLKPEATESLRLKPEATEGELNWTPPFFEGLLGTRVRSVVPLGSGSEHSIVSELASWRTGRPSGLFRFRIELETAGAIQPHDVIVKVKPSDRRVIDVGEALARVCDDGIGKAYARWGERLGLLGGHIRELEIFAQSDPRFTRHAPARLASLEDPEHASWILVLERVTDGVLMDSASRPEAWTGTHLDSAIRGLAALQAIWFGREADLSRAPWIGHVATAASVADMTDLWTALARDSTPRFSSWGDPAIGSIQRGLVDTIRRWWPDLEIGSRTLIHNDFNPRNICLRPGPSGLRLCAYDWELATIGAPQHDLAELLCFVLSPDAPASDIDRWVERHRLALVEETGTAVDPDVWRRGFRASVFDLMINRLPMYALVDRIRRQPFLPRLVRTWRRLYEHVSAGYQRPAPGSSLRASGLS